MGLALCSFGLTALIAIGVGCAVYGCVSWFRTHSTARIAAAISMAALSAILFMPTLYGMAWLTTTIKVGVSAEEAKAVLGLYGVPASAASDVSYRTAAYGCPVRIDFVMSESDFLSWMQSQGWTPERFTFQEEGEALTFPVRGENWNIHTDVTPIRDWASGTWVVVLDGYCYFRPGPEDFDGSLTIVYDLQTNRVYLTQC
jgi:hypothetical protein